MRKGKFTVRVLLAPALGAVLGFVVHAVWAAGGDDVFATVDEFEITRNEFDRAVYSAARQTYYHGQPPAGEELIQFRKGVAEQLIDRFLLLQEAKRRNLEPDHNSINEKIAGYESRYGATERWQTEGPQMVAALRVRFEEESVLEALEADVRSVAAPNDEVLRTFYESSPEMFTEPPQNRAAVILLGVAPSSEPRVWQAAREEAQRVLERLQDGKSFEELAALHSSDPSAQSGGDMGYLHAGMLSTAAEDAIAGLDIGDVSNLVQVLEGIAVFKLLERKPEYLRSYGEVKARAGELWLRYEGDQHWNGLVADLRSASTVKVDTDYLVTLPDNAD